MMMSSRRPTQKDGSIGDEGREKGKKEKKVGRKPFLLPFSVYFLRWRDVNPPGLDEK